MVSALAVALGLAIIATPAAHADPLTGTVSGTVTSTVTGLPIQGLQVQVYNLIDDGADVTDANGEFEVTGLPPGEYRVYYNGPVSGYVGEYWQSTQDPNDATVLTITGGSEFTGIDAALTPAATIEGRVVKASDPNVGISGLQVSAYEDNYGPGSGDAWTDSNGYYSITGLSAASYRVSFFGTSLGYEEKYWNDTYDYYSANLITVAAGETATGIDAQLAEEATISGRVVSSTDPTEGLEDVWVQLTSDDGANGVGRYTDANGEYSVEGLPAGHYRVEFQGDNVSHINEYWQDTTSYFSALLIAVVPGQHVTGIDATLEPSASIAGRVTSDDTGEPIAGVWVYANSVDGGYGSATTDYNGEYFIGGLGAGDYRVNFVPNSQILNYLPESWDDQSSDETATIIPVELLEVVTGVDASLATGSIITGNVKGDDGSGPVNLEGVTVSARTDYTMNAQVTNGYAVTDENGDFTMQGLAPGEYQLDYNTEGTGTRFAPQVRDELVEVGVKQTLTDIDIVLGLGARISGVVNGQGGPLAGIELMIRHVDEEWYYEQTADTTASDGSYETRILAPGTYWLTAGPRWDSELNYLPQSELVTVTAAGDVIQNFVLQPGGSIAGTVTGPGGAPLTNAQVQVSSEDGSSWFVSTDNDGDYLATELPPGSYTVSFRDMASGSNLATEWWQDAGSPSDATEIELAVGQLVTDIDAQLSEGSTISGTMRDEDGGLVETWFYPVVRDAVTNAQVPVNYSYDDSTGDYVILGLPVGSFKVGFSDRNFGDLTDEFDGSGDLNGVKYDPPYLDGKTSWATADVITVTSAGQELTGHDVIALELSPPKQYSVVPLPTISGALVQGETLTATLGAWVPNNQHPKYRWLRDGEPINFATGTSYTLRSTDVGHQISVQVTGTLIGYAETVTTSAETTPVVGPVATVPVPTITGDAAVGETLTAHPGSWAAGTTLAYQWTRDGVAISGATAATYQPVAADLGALLAVVVSGSNGGSHLADSISLVTAPIEEGTITPGTVSIDGTPQVGLELTADVGDWDPADVDFGYVWKSNGEAIAGATDSSYTPTAEQEGKTISLVVTGSKAGYAEATATSLGVTVTAAAITAGTPTITGTPVVGGTLTADPGEWDPSGVEFSYQWAVDGEDVAGATGATFTPRAADVGSTITVEVTGSYESRTPVTAASAPTAEVAPGDLVTGTVTITGTAVVDGTLTAHPGTWSPTGVAFAYQWAVDGVDVAGATGATFSPRAADVGKSVTVTVTGSLSGYTPATEESAETTEVAAAEFVTVPPTITGTAKVGETLTATVPAWTPAATSLSYQWKADGSVVGGDSATLALTTAEAGKTITVTVTGTRDGYTTASASSAPTSEVATGDLVAGTPTISGTPVVDGTLTASPGTWSPSGASFSYQWAVDGENVAGATGSTFSPRAADVGLTITVTVTGTLAGYVPASASSAPTAAVAEGTFTTVAPTISGTAQVGVTLTASVPAWTPEVTSLSYQWKADGSPIGTDSASLVLTAAEAGATITVTVTGARDGYTAASATSLGTSEVALGELVAGTAAISGTPVVDGTLTANPGTWSPAGVSFAYQWAVDGEDVAGATGSTFTPRAADVGLTVTVTVTGTLAGYAADSVTSAPTAAVAEGTFTTVAPTISGTTQVGETLTATVPAWTPEASSLSYQWKADGSPIGTDSATLLLTAAEEGTTITVTVTGARDGYTTASASSTPTGEVTGAELVAGTPTISGTAVVDGTLTAHPGTWSPTGVAFAYQWAVDGEDVAGATGSTFTPRAADVGLTVTVTVTGTLAGHTPATASSAPTAAVAAAEFGTVTAPTVSGSAKVGETLTASVSGWSPAPASTTFQWLADGAVIAGATGSSLVLDADLLGKRISVSVTGSRPGYESETRTSAQTAPVAAAELEEPTRLAGTTRFDTAVAISASYFEPGVERVYLANGYGYPDALSAAPAAAHFDSPLLLTEPKSVPTAVLAEINRLQPAEIVIVGGTGAVTDAVKNTLAALTFGPEVRRIGGLDRFETSRALAEDTWGAGEAETAYLATGLNFPDALSASPAAAHFDGPVVLVPGMAASVDAVTRSLLDELGVEKVKLAGGTGVISSAIESQLKGIFGAANVIRNGGADRYLTSVVINADAFDSATTVYLATGSNYADALAGAALAGTNDSPLFTTQPHCVPQAALDAIEDLGATKVVLLGGTGVLTPAVENLTSCG